MSNIIVRESKHRIDPKFPQRTDPDYATDHAKGQQVLKKGLLKFDNRGDEEAYWKGVRSNPANVPGLPNFFPPLPEPKSFLSLDRAARECQCGGCCTANDNFVCPRCGRSNASIIN